MIKTFWKRLRHLKFYDIKNQVMTFRNIYIYINIYLYYEVHYITYNYCIAIYGAYFLD